MINITTIDHVGIRVKELASARSFYEKLGFVFIEGPTGPEPVAIMRHPCGVVINFILNANVNSNGNILMDISHKHPGYTHIALRVDDLTEVKMQLEQLNIVINEGPIDFGNNHGSSLFIRDQDSNIIEFHQLASE